MDTTAKRTITAQPIASESYSRFGKVIAADETQPWSPANFGRAKRFNHQVDIVNLRPEDAHLNVCVFRCSAIAEDSLSVDLLERHEFSTQVFMPMHNGRFITIVANGGDKPDLSTIAAFVIEAPTGISYNPGIWHYPMTALGSELDLSCLVCENGTSGDCEVQKLDENIIIRLE